MKNDNNNNIFPCKKGNEENYYKILPKTRTLLTVSIIGTIKK